MQRDDIQETESAGAFNASIGTGPGGEPPVAGLGSNPPAKRRNAGKLPGLHNKPLRTIVKRSPLNSLKR